MLVLGRKADQSIRFPSLGITIQILKVNGSSVSVGIDAPTEFRIVRDELSGYAGGKPLPQSHVFRLPKEVRHDLRNQLNEVTLALQLFRAEVDAGQHEQAEQTFDSLLRSLQNVSTSQVLSRQGVTVSDTTAMTALLIEDHANEREMLAGFLRLKGFHIDTVSNGREALNYLESNEKPRLALVDMGLPELDGASTIRCIRENDFLDDLLVYGLSGSTVEENGLDMASDRIDGWFMKPLDPGSLVDMLVSNVNGKVTAA